MRRVLPEKRSHTSETPLFPKAALPVGQRDSRSGGDRVEGREAVDDCHGKYSTRLRGDLSQNDLRYHPDAQ